MAYSSHGEGLPWLCLSLLGCGHGSHGSDSDFSGCSLGLRGYGSGSCGTSSSGHGFCTSGHRSHGLAVAVALAMTLLW